MSGANPSHVTRFDLSSVPDGAVLRSVVAKPGRVVHRNGLRVSLTAAAVARVPEIDYIDRPTFVMLPVTFERGRIAVDLHSQLTASAPDYARGCRDRLPDRG